MYYIKNNLHTVSNIHIEAIDNVDVQVKVAKNYRQNRHTIVYLLPIPCCLPHRQEKCKV